MTDIQELQRTLSLVDIAMLCVANTPLTLNSETGLKQCMSWLSEVKESAAVQLKERLENEKAEYHQS